MGFDINKMPYILEQLRLHKKKAGFNDAQLAAQINTFAHTGWGENYIHDLLAGKMPLSHSADDTFQKYLALKFYDYNCTA